MLHPSCRSSACKAKSEQQILRADFVYGGAEDHNFWQCQECDLVYLWPGLSPAEESKFYAQEFEKFMESRAGESRGWSSPKLHVKANQGQIKRRWSFLTNYLEVGCDILEIGCSSGFMLDAFKENGFKCIGIEPSGVFSDFLSQSGHNHYRSISELLEEKPRKKFDLIVHFFVLEHISDTRGFLEEQLDLLKPAGTIIAEVPCVNDPLTSLYKIPAFEKFYWSIAHHYYFNPKSLSLILDQMDCSYQFIPEQRYDLSNHLIWMQEGRPGGQGLYDSVFSEKTLISYENDLKAGWNCDTFFLYINKN